MYTLSHHQKTVLVRPPLTLRQVTVYQIYYVGVTTQRGEDSFKAISATTCKVQSTGAERQLGLIIVPSEAPTLLSRNDSIASGIFGNGVTCSVESDIMSDMKNLYPSVFRGLGRLRDYQVRLHIDKAITPVCQPVRRIPFQP